MRKVNYIILLLLISCSLTYAVGIGDDWSTIPGFESDSPLTISDRNTYLIYTSLAALSYSLCEFVLDSSANQENYLHAKVGMNKEYAWGMRKVWHQSFGIEHRVSSWFSVSLDYTLQEFRDNTPHLKLGDRSGFGTGIMTYYRWFIFGNYKISPYIEYGTGIFLGFEKFPYNGTHYTFNNSTLIGIEVTLSESSKLRLGYGNYNQSNYNLNEHNPAHDADGFSLVYSWKWD